MMQTGSYEIEIKGLAEPSSKEAARICQEDLNEVIDSFIQEKTAIERGLFDEELVPDELTQVRMGNIIKDKYPELDAEDHGDFQGSCRVNHSRCLSFLSAVDLTFRVEPHHVRQRPVTDRS